MCVSRLVLSMALLLSGFAVPVYPVAPPTVAIHVVDYAFVDGGILSQAQHAVERLYGTAGIRTVWRDEASPPPSTQKGHVTVIILSDAMARNKTESDVRDGAVLGSAAPSPVSRAWIFFGRIDDVAALRGLATGTLLGHVIAHEVAHVVAHLAHSSCGTMDAVLKPLAADCQGFTNAERERLLLALNDDATESASSDVLARLDRRLIGIAR